MPLTRHYYPSRRNFPKLQVVRLGGRSSQLSLLHPSHHLTPDMFRHIRRFSTSSVPRAVAAASKAAPAAKPAAVRATSARATTSTAAAARAPAARATATPTRVTKTAVAARPKLLKEDEDFPMPEDVEIAKPPGLLGDAAPRDAAASDAASAAPLAPAAFAAYVNYDASAAASAAPVQEVDWTTSYQGLSVAPFTPEAAAALLRPLSAEDVEIKPDGLLYLPEIKYRRTLNVAFGPGGWGMVPRSDVEVGPRIVSREWGLVCLGRLVAIARGEQEYFDPSGVPTAIEASKSNALMRCCKDLGVASELWDPRFIRQFKAKHCTEAMVEHMRDKKKRKLWRRKDAKFDYPYKEIGTL